MKMLPAKWRELQSDAFAKVGISWAANVVQFLVPEDPNDPCFPWNLAEKRADLQPGSILTVFLIACSNDSNQNAWGVFSINSAFKAEIKKLSPFTTESLMVTDGAAYYSCTQTALLHRSLARATGISVVLKIHTVAGHGKGDSFFSTEKKHLWLSQIKNRNFMATLLFELDGSVERSRGAGSFALLAIFWGGQEDPQKS